MKLGDNMTMDAYNIWGSVPPRKCRPPRIGDIPKHGAVDEESPGSSSKKLTISPSDSREPPLDVSLDSARNIIFPLPSCPAGETFPGIPKFEEKHYPTIYTEKDSAKYSVKEPETANFHIKSSDNDSYSMQTEHKSPVEHSTSTKHQIFPNESSNQKLSAEQLKISNPRSKVTIKLSCNEETVKLPGKSTLSETYESPRIPLSPGDVSERGIVEVRKDSALFLEEEEGLSALREILKSKAPRIIRPRRESSGYSSNLGTFDEDRRNSSSVDVLQDFSFLKERRRSSTKRLNSRIGIGKREDSLTEESGNCSLDRMPTTEIFRNVSSAGLEMPNIVEVKEILREEASSAQEILDNPCNMLERIAIDERSVRTPILEEADTRAILLKKDVEDKMSTLDASSTCVRPAFQNASDVFNTTSLKRSIDNIAQQNPLSTTSGNYSLENVLRKTTPERSHSSVHQSKLQNPSLPATCTAFLEFDQPSESYKEDVISFPGNDRESDKLLPKSIKVYQLLSTQSEDRADGEPHLADRRISLQISKHDDDVLPMIPSNESDDISFRVSESLSTAKVKESGDLRVQKEPSQATDDSPIRKLSSPGEMATSQRFLGDVNVSVRPIYPYCPYSPYGSPQGSPRNRRRPLRESRRVSIDNRQGALQLNQYKLLDNIGQGSYGIVKLVFNEEDETHYAMKILSKKKLMKKAGIFGRMAPGRKGAANPLAKVYREIALLKKLDHPNVVKLVEVLDDPDEDNLYLVFELVQRGEVLQIPADKPLDEETARKNFRDVVMGVEYLHYQRIVHRDIKPSNLLVDSDGRIKIADLGVSAELRASGELLSGPAGTPAFAAPETTTPGGHYSGTLCDVWSMGVTLYSLVTGRVPWDGAGSIIGVQAAVRTEPLKFPETCTLSNNLRELITKMLAKDPGERVQLSEIKEHPWLTKSGAEPLPSEADNCRLPVTVTDEEVERVVTRVPKLDTLILIKTMLKQHSFQNPFLPKKTGKAACNETSLELSTAGAATDNFVQCETVRNVKSERFQRAGRSNSAPDSYDWHPNGRQISVESPLPPVTEVSSQETEVEKR